MRGINKVILIGNATRDAELRPRWRGSPMTRRRRRVIPAPRLASVGDAFCDALRRLTAGGIALGTGVALARRPVSAQLSPESAATEAAARSAIEVINGDPQVTHTVSEAGSLTRVD